MPYALLGVALWACVHAGGLHATLAGVVLAVLIPTRPPPNLKALMAQAEAILRRRKPQRGRSVLRHGPSRARAAGARRDPRPARIAGRRARCARSSPGRASSCCRCSRSPTRASRSSTDVLGGREPLVAGDRARPRRRQAARLLSRPRPCRRPRASRSSPPRTRGASSPAPARWPASASRCRCSSPAQAFPVAGDFAAAKLAVFAASVAVCDIGVAVLWRPARAARPPPVEAAEPRFGRSDVGEAA